MALKAIIHYSKDEKQIQQIYNIITQFRAEKTAQYITKLGITYDTLVELLKPDKNV